MGGGPTRSGLGRLRVLLCLGPGRVEKPKRFEIAGKLPGCRKDALVLQPQILGTYSTVTRAASPFQVTISTSALSNASFLRDAPEK